MLPGASRLMWYCFGWYHTLVIKKLIYSLLLNGKCYSDATPWGCLVCCPSECIHSLMVIGQWQVIIGSLIKSNITNFTCYYGVVAFTDLIEHLSGLEFPKFIPVILFCLCLMNYWIVSVTVISSICLFKQLVLSLVIWPPLYGSLISTQEMPANDVYCVMLHVLSVHNLLGYFYNVLLQV